MGLTLSAPSKTLTPEQEDVQFLGDRMPFGDEELWHVYRAYRELKNYDSTTTDRISFLTDVAVATVPSSAQEQQNQNQNQKREERLVVVQAAEQKILPAQFGNRLYETAFCQNLQDAEYASKGDGAPPGTTNNNSNNTADAYTKRSQLEAFFDGLSNCSRRGTQKSLKVLFHCCQPVKQQQVPAFESAAETAEVVVVDPMELVYMGYRVGLASAFLTAASDDEEDDVSRFFPVETEASGNNSHNSQGLSALAESLKDFATKRQQRLNRGMATPGGGAAAAAAAAAANEKVQLVTEQDVQEWAEQVAPMFGSSLATLMHTIFFPDRPYPPTRTSFDFPTLAGFESTFFPHGSSPLLFSFGCMSPALGGEYYRLYTSASDGLSFNRLQNALLGYGGPTLIIIQSTGADASCVFGAFTASAWKESKDFYGNHDCFLYQLLPQTHVYRPSGNDTHFMYCNSSARSRGYDQQAHGIGFGGSVNRPRLFLAETFDDCRAGVHDLTFEGGRLLSSGGQSFEIDSLEVWGVGGTDVVQDALGARSRQRDIKNAAIQKARKVDKAQFLDDFKSGLIESKAFQHRDQIRGREGAVVDNEDQSNYKYPEK